MRLGQSFAMAIKSIKNNKGRSFLTMLGIIIGVGAIIALMTVVQGATDTMNAQFDAMGLGTLRVSVAGTAIKHGLTDDDLQTILDCEHVAGISPSLNATVTAKRGNVWSDSISVNGNNDEYFRHNPDLLRRGRAIDVLDVENNARVCLVDGDAAKTLFFGEDPVGQTFYLDGFEYTVVGMIDEDENASLFSQILMGGKTDGTVYVPYSSAKKLLGTSTVTTFIESASGVEAGGRTGLTALTTGVLFLLSILISPLILSAVTNAVTAPALVVVGVMMAQQLKSIDWEDMMIAAAAFVTIIVMVLGYSISNGIAFGFIVYTIGMIGAGKTKDIHPTVWVLDVIFLIYFWVTFA